MTTTSMITDAPRKDPEILVAAPVAFNRDGSLDIGGSREILEKVAQSRADGAFISGTTGEFVALLESERQSLTALAAEVLAEKKVVVHVGAASAWEVERLIDGVRDSGLMHVAAITPFYFKASPKAVFDFYEEISRMADGLQAYAYVFTDRTSNDVAPKELASIAQLPNVVGVKASGVSLAGVEAYVSATPDGFRVFTGSDRDLARITAVGAHGVVSGIASVFPDAFTNLREAVISQDEAEIALCQRIVDEVIDALLGDPARLKAALRLQGINGGYARMPLDEPDGPVLAEIVRVVKEYA